LKHQQLEFVCGVSVSSKFISNVPENEVLPAKNDLVASDKAVSSTTSPVVSSVKPVSSPTAVPPAVTTPSFPVMCLPFFVLV
jgi:hypothetical protein